MNAIVISGNLTEDPEKVKYGENKNFLVNFRIGNNEYVNGKSVSNGFFDITVFGEQGKYVLKSFKKGERVVVSGRLQHTTYDKDDGSKGGRIRIIANEVGLSTLFEKAGRKKASPSEGPFTN